MAADVYMDRDSKFTLSLTQDGVAPNENVITKAVLWIPGNAFADGNPQIADSSPQVTLIENATKVTFALADMNLQTGSFYCYLTIYDAVNVNGIPWDTLIIQVKNWPATV